MSGCSSVLYVLVVVSCLLSCALAFFGQSIVKSKPQSPPPPPPAQPSEPATPPPPQPLLERGIIEYTGNTLLEKPSHKPRWSTDQGPTWRNVSSSKEIFLTKFNLWRQWPWKKINGKVVLSIKLGGSLSLESSLTRSSPFSNIGGPPPDFLVVNSLSDFQTLMSYAAHDPRVSSILIQLEGFQCGYAKLEEVRRSIKYFQQSGKKVVAYASAGAEKEVFIALECDSFYVPPDGGLDLRGFSGAATFVRGIFDKLGIEPQVQRIGKYKSFGDTFNRTGISEAQREVISSLLMESSDFWADSIANKLGKDVEEIKKLWSDDMIRTPYDYRADGFVTGVKYLDQVESIIINEYKAKLNITVDSDDINNANEDYLLENEFVRQPRRDFLEVRNNTEFSKEAMKKKAKDSKKIPSFFPARTYLKKMRNGGKILSGLRVKETRGGDRIAIINAVGGISTGKSSRSGPTGASLGSDSVIELVRKAKLNPSIKACVIRVDSPGGSALASDLMWREIRQLSLVKPVVASQVDVAASGGYYISMACDKIVAEEFTVTGSIGVVTSKFNAEKLFEKIGYGTETISRGRFAEVLTASRGFTEDEEKYFSDSAEKAYKSFTTKAAYSRSKSVDDLLEYAQGRVWTGKQAYYRGLVDEVGGIWKALNIALNMTDMNTTKTHCIPIEVLVDRSSMGLGIPGIGRSIRDGFEMEPYLQKSLDLLTAPQYMCEDYIASLNLASPEALGMSNEMVKLGLGPFSSQILNIQLGVSDTLMSLLPVVMEGLF